MKKKFAVLLAAALAVTMISTSLVSADAAVDSAEAAVEQDAGVGLGTAIAESDKENFEEIDKSEALDLLEPESEEAKSRGFSTVAGTLEEYKVFYVYQDSGIDEYTLWYFDPVSRVISCYVDILDLSKAYYSYDYVANLNLNNLIPGYSSMNFADAYILDCGDFYRVEIFFENLTDPNNVSALVRAGVIQMGSGYTSGMCIDADSSAAMMKSAGAVELSDYEVSQLGINT